MYVNALNNGHAIAVAGPQERMKNLCCKLKQPLETFIPPHFSQSTGICDKLKGGENIFNYSK